MTKRVLNGLRKYQILRWVESLNDGFMERGEIQYASTANIAAHMIEWRVMEDRLREKFGRRAIRRRDKEVVGYMRQFLSNKLKDYMGSGLLRHRPKRVKKNEDNHLYIDKGIHVQRREVDVWQVTASGKAKMEDLEERFQKQRNGASKYDLDVEHDIVKVPNETRWEWEIEEYEVPRIHKGEIVDTGREVPIPY